MQNLLNVLDLFNGTMDAVNNIKDLSSEDAFRGVVFVGVLLFSKKDSTTTVNINFYLDKDNNEEDKK